MRSGVIDLFGKLARFHLANEDDESARDCMRIRIEMEAGIR